MKIPCLFLLLVTILISCTTVPETPSSTIQSTAINSFIPSPINTATPPPTAQPTATIHPQVQQQLAGADALLPTGSLLLSNQAWISNAAGNYWGGAYIPYRTENGVSLLVLGQPRQEDGSWNGEHVRIWDWQDTGLEPMIWQDIRPVGRGQSSFLGLDQGGHWWAVMSQMDWDVPELVLLGIFRVSSLEDVQVGNMGLYPIEELGDLQIERIGLYPEEEKTRNLTYFIFRENGRMILYKMDNAQAHEIWSTDRVMQGRFHIHSHASPGGSVDMTGDGRPEVIIVWDLNFPPLIDVYQVGDNVPEVLHWLGRFDSTWQYTDATGDGIPDFLQPDDPENPKRWQVVSWNGSEFVQGEISFPQPISPPPVIISDPENLPPLSSGIVYRFGNFDEWWRWSGDGGLIEVMSKPPSHMYDECAPHDFGGYGDACYSPAGRFKLISIAPYIEGSFTGILDGLNDNRVTIPGSFVYTEGYNTFAWSPDEKFLLFARGDDVASLTMVDPVSGDSPTVLNVSLCGLDIWDCRNYAGSLAITDPVVFDDGSLGFAFQSASPSLYPPPGIYRMSTDGELTMLVALPYIDESKGISPNMPPNAPIYGYLLWSPDKSTFLYYDFFVGDKKGFRILLMGRADGSALWDLREVFSDVREFRWER